MIRYLALLLLCASAHASTYYVRVDGGDAAHCNGTANVAYSAAVSPVCAWSNPMFATPPNRDGNDVGRKPLIAGGDTLNIGPGSYQMGLPFNGGSWGSCSMNWPWDCHSQPIPSGTPSSPTKIIGAGSGLTQLWGSGGASFVVNLSGSSNVILQGLEITDHSNCIQKHTDPTVACQAGGLWATNGISDTEGGTDTPQSSNVTLTDVYVHGMAKFGINAGHINNWTLTNVRIIANGFGGWSLDTGTSYSTGTNTITSSEISYNGCTENYPAATIYACWGQMTNGYGDGLGSSSASDHGTWTFQDVKVFSNTQDGLDFLHADPSAVITFDRVNAQRNAGNQIKGNGSVTIKNSVINGFCSSLASAGSIVGNNSGGGGTSGDVCRALGDAVVLGQSAGHSTSVQSSTIISEGNCLITVPDTGVGDSTSKLVVTNNILIGQPVWVDGNQTPPPQSCLYYWNSSNVPTFSGNVIWQTKGGTAPAGNTYADPRLANETLAAFDPTPTAATPPGVGAVQTSVTPPAVACSGGIVSAGTCYCPANTTLLSGACGPLPAQCKPVAVCTNTATSMSCTGACQ